ncbi:hypothetical protein [Pseudomonas viridiflava]|uniref:hypothetical protein n=1 Tax=Pseudomonas syringae group TaxID=136849 RepID=UPI0013CF21C1|nr:hypothetical protein [Pseudomonas viridiflava]MEE4675473.1 hypothetical protein [Pseudomonas alliivorans]MEE4701275.1 hypothetical protein [Pseudomonas alliivorans]MEE4737191.1 hypothetical protein [Pseudomonas alliivorans]
MINESIDASVFDRWCKLDGYRPKNLVEWAGQLGVDPGKILSSVLASSPATAVPD